MDLTGWDYEAARHQFGQDLAEVASADDLEQLRIRYLGKKQGVVTGLLAGLREVPRELKPKLGKELNLFKREVEQAIKTHDLKASAPAHAKRKLDLTLPGVRPAFGSLHPLTQIEDELLDFFLSLGYDIGEGPEIESAYYNFEALNTPEGHPARAEADTFYMYDERMLRTQTSGVQIRYMENHQPPFRMVAPGRVYRRDDDLTHSPMFHQLEGLVVGDIHFGHLKGTLQEFAKHLFGAQTRIRLRSSYFPFTEPSAELDVTCPFCSDGCRVCKGTRWIEILGCGMVDPNVFVSVGYDPERWTGFAFGMGIERIAMLALGVNDIRLFFQNDRRFLDQFRVG